MTWLSTVNDRTALCSQFQCAASRLHTTMLGTFPINKFILQYGYREQAKFTYQSRNNSTSQTSGRALLLSPRSSRSADNSASDGVKISKVLVALFFKKRRHELTSLVNDFRHCLYVFKRFCIKFNLFLLFWIPWWRKWNHASEDYAVMIE